MNLVYDGAIIFDCSGTFETDRFRTEIIRPLAPFALHQTISQYELNSTVINYTDAWDPDVLTNTLSTWLDHNNIKRPLLLVSTLFSLGVFTEDKVITKVITTLKTQYNCTVLLGGPINVLDYNIELLKPDIVFQGRSLHLFEKWLTGDWDDLPIQLINGIEVFHDTSSQVKEDPVVPILYDDYCLTSDDILHFETRLGCKFNCTFCTFEYRNAKKVNDSRAEQLYNFFHTANTVYGISNFSCVDDTFNEDQSKIDTLHNAVTQLDYQPKIVGYNRFDLMMHRPEQAHQLDECGFHGHYFGIETLHRDASKMIRKGIKKERAFDFLKMLRDDYSHWWTCSGYIVGLPLEPVAHIKSVMRDIREQKLLKSVIPVGLGLYNIPGNEHNFSEFSKNPEQYGITVMETGIDANWYHDLINRDGAKILANQLAAKNDQANMPARDPWEWISRSIAPTNQIADDQIKQYIIRKIAFLTR